MLGLDSESVTSESGTQQVSDSSPQPTELDAAALRLQLAAVQAEMRRAKANNKHMQRQVQRLQNENFGLNQQILAERERANQIRSDASRLTADLEAGSERVFNSAARTRRGSSEDVMTRSMGPPSTSAGLQLSHSMLAGDSMNGSVLSTDIPTRSRVGSLGGGSMASPRPFPVSMSSNQSIYSGFDPNEAHSMSRMTPSNSYSKLEGFAEAQRLDPSHDSMEPGHQHHPYGRASSSDTASETLFAAMRRHSDASLMDSLRAGEASPMSAAAHPTSAGTPHLSDDITTPSQPSPLVMGKDRPNLQSEAGELTSTSPRQGTVAQAAAKSEASATGPAPTPTVGQSAPKRVVHPPKLP